MHLHTRTSFPKFNHSREQENHQAFRCFETYDFNAKSEARKPFQAPNLVFFNALIVVPSKALKGLQRNTYFGYSPSEYGFHIGASEAQRFQTLLNGRNCFIFVVFQALLRNDTWYSDGGKE